MILDRQAFQRYMRLFPWLAPADLTDDQYVEAYRQGEALIYSKLHDRYPAPWDYENLPETARAVVLALYKRAIALRAFEMGYFRLRDGADIPPSLTGIADSLDAIASYAESIPGMDELPRAGLTVEALEPVDLYDQQLTAEASA